MLAQFLKRERERERERVLRLQAREYGHDRAAAAEPGFPPINP